MYVCMYVCSRVQKFPAWHTKAAPNGKCCEGYVVPSRVTSSQMWKVCWNKGRLRWKIAKLFYFCHLKKFVRPETFGPYHVCMYVLPDVYKTQSVTHREKLVRERRAKGDIWPQQRRSNGHDKITYVVFSSRAAILNLRCTDFKGSVNLDTKNSTTLFALTANWNTAFHSRMNAGNKVIYGF